MEEPQSPLSPGTYAIVSFAWRIYYYILIFPLLKFRRIAVIPLLLESVCASLMYALLAASVSLYTTLVYQCRCLLAFN